LVHVLETALRLLHPFMPFQSEQLFQALRPLVPNSAESLMIAPWPKPEAGWRDAEAKRRMGRLQNIVTATRTARSEMNVPPGLKVSAVVNTKDKEWVELLGDRNAASSLQFLANIETLSQGAQRPPESAVAVFEGGEVYIPLTGLIDKEKERLRLTKNSLQIQQQIERGERQLSNQDFLERAPKEEVQNLRQNVEGLRAQAESLRRNLEGLS
jgi:valyl-tRNA synthetase